MQAFDQHLLRESEEGEGKRRKQLDSLPSPNLDQPVAPTRREPLNLLQRLLPSRALLSSISISVRQRTDANCRSPGDAGDAEGVGGEEGGFPGAIVYGEKIIRMGEMEERKGGGKEDGLLKVNTETLPSDEAQARIGPSS